MNSDDLLNLKTRAKVLEHSLLLEAKLSEILISLFKIKKAEINTLGNKSSSISFKTKVDFLYDLERVDKDLYKDLILFMEIRNQFIHNSNAISFVKVLSGFSRKSRLHEVVDSFKEYFDDQTFKDEEKEGLYDVAFGKLCLLIMEKLLKVQLQIANEIAEEAGKDFYKEGVKLYDEAIDEFAKELNEFWKGEGVESEMGDIVKAAIRTKLKEKLEKKYNFKFSDEIK